MGNAELEIQGRHDVCVVPRAVPVVFAMDGGDNCGLRVTIQVDPGGHQMSLEEMRKRIDEVDEGNCSFARGKDQAVAIDRPGETERTANRLRTRPAKKRSCHTLLAIARAEQVDEKKYRMSTARYLNPLRACRELLSHFRVNSGPTVKKRFFNTSVIRSWPKPCESFDAVFRLVEQGAGRFRGSARWKLPWKAALAGSTTFC